ncbi:cysteine desulfurase [Sulfobacillus thermosulfidooxidans]|uniref:cysteine desulfurase n=1 Tax=Sulfobacillus thermosulfidooxidans TaxID=28034 RepID=UPI00096B8C1D|nr:cysteine desulfurase [Sulfobacillus thermosulfidooxidans]OLZ08566.1 cysteine desulfurase [Sulfobacillus thermosulfidooxidans]OLZ13168.1 cysteine desulfurase [Sulfobacillus thermosulfidooxidans]OLZ21548.1 cysteine desulfurase [Sulfobacillus thermosulfidooxidans]
MITALVDITEDFPILKRQINGHRLIYLDSAATSQKPQSVIDRLVQYYETTNANVLRSVHTLAEEATTAMEEDREKIARFIHAKSPREVIFTRGTTESLNTIARAWGDKFLEAGDEIVLSPMEHHSNLIPWQQLAKRVGAKLKFIELQPNGTITVEAVKQQITERTRIVTLSAVSNVLGTINPIAEVAVLAHQVGAIMVVDGAQSVPHGPTDVQALGIDFLAFSGHKMLGPTGIGVLWGKEALLEAADPVMFGGEMIAYVDRDDATWAELPAKFEGGTPHIAGAIGLGTAIDYLSTIGMERIEEHSRMLAEEAYRRLANLSDVVVYGPEYPRTSLVAFNIVGIHPHDIAQVFDSRGIAIRAGHHCAQPLMHWLDVSSTARASFYLYNSDRDIDELVDAIEATKRYFKR